MVIPPPSFILNTGAYFDRAESDFAPLGRGLGETKHFLIEHNAQICVGECKSGSKGYGNPYNTFCLTDNLFNN
jgi:hypothetical protein